MRKTSTQPGPYRKGFKFYNDIKYNVFLITINFILIHDGKCGYSQSCGTHRYHFYCVFLRVNATGLCGKFHTNHIYPVSTQE